MSDVNWPLVFLGVGAGAAVAIAVLLAVLVMQVPRIVQRILFVGDKVDTVACHVETCQRHLHHLEMEIEKGSARIAGAVSGASASVSSQLSDGRQEAGLGYGGIFR